MAFIFEELDATTRALMLEEFRNELADRPYRSSRLSDLGWENFLAQMETAIREGNEESLAIALAPGILWRSTEGSHTKKGRPIVKRVDPHRHEILARCEFNTWYVRALSRKLMQEGVEFCEVYRAAPAWEPRDECEILEYQRFPVEQIYKGHRARYWPPPGIRGALSIPVGANCHHSIRRVIEHTLATLPNV